MQSVINQKDRISEMKIYVRQLQHPRLTKGMHAHPLPVIFMFRWRACACILAWFAFSDMDILFDTDILWSLPRSPSPFPVSRQDTILLRVVEISISISPPPR